jgi:hypothetical protein
MRLAKSSALHRIRATALRLVEKDFAHHPHDVAAPLLGRDVLLDAVGIENQADLVTVADGREGEHAGQLGGEFALALRAEPKLPEALTSTSRRMVSSRSSVNFLTNGRPARAVTFQSIVRTSSPATYSRTSSKFIPRPLNTD